MNSKPIFRTYFSGDWDVHQGYSFFDPWPNVGSSGESKVEETGSQIWGVQGGFSASLLERSIPGLDVNQGVKFVE